MNILEMKDRVLFALSVPKCVCCRQKLDFGQKALCGECSESLEEYSVRSCSRCARPLMECNCSNKFLETHFVKQVIKCYRYKSDDDTSPSSALIYSLKRDNRNDVLDKTSDLLIKALTNNFDDLCDCIITNIPRREAAIVEYGLDHSALLAKEIARKNGAEYISFFKSKAKREQKSLNHLERRKNADFILTHECDLTKRRVIIVDDIITSGASMSNAATLLRSLNCRDITAAALAIAYKDD